MNVILKSINNVQDYIEKHLDEVLTTEMLAEIAHFSPYYFHRTYSAVTGESLYGFIKRLRLEKAAFLLLSNKQMAITDVALSVGFSSTANFGKAFKLAYGVSATQFKKSKDGKVISNDLIYNGEKAFEAYYESIQSMTPIQVDISRYERKRVVYHRYKGPYKGDSQLFQQLFTQLYNWANKKGLDTGAANWYTLYHDFGSMTDAQDLRLDVCMETNETVVSDGGFGVGFIEEGLYVVARFELGTEDYQKAWDYMFMHWLPSQPYYNDDRFSYEAYPQLKAVSSNKRVVDLCIPIAPLKR